MPASLRTLVVDDEPIARQLLRSALETHPSVTLVGESENGFDAISAITTLNPDLVLLDIQMPDADGFEVIEALDAASRPAVIFVTAFDRYAVRAFRIHAVDYLLKPVDELLLAEAVARAAQQFGTGQWMHLQTRLSELVRELGGRQQFNPEWFVVRRDDERIPLRWREVERLEAAQNYVRVHTGGAVFLLRTTLQTLAERLECQGFVRVHRSNVINVAKIECIYPCSHGDFEVELSDGSRVPLSRRYRPQLEAILGSLG